MSILIVGTVAFDTIHTPHGSAEMVIGGSGQYGAYAASYFHPDVNLVSIIGDDFPDAELKDLNSRGVKTDGVKVVDGGKSFFWEGRYHDNMNDRDTIVTDLNVLADFDPVLPDSYKTSEYVMLGNLTPDIQLSVLDQLEVTPKLVMLDTMNLWIDIALEPLKQAISRCDVLTINDEEARMLSGEHSIVQAAAKILELGPRYLIIKKGEHGALLFDQDNVFYAPAMPLGKVTDPTGAGDCFAGGFLGYIAKAQDVSFDNMKRALIYGSAMASFVVEDFSNHRIKSITQADIRERVIDFVKLSQFTV